MKIREFGVEIWMNEYENRCQYNLAETCVESLTIDQLLSMTDDKHAALHELLPMKMTYGAIQGSERLRKAIETLYTQQMSENIIVTHGAIGANALVHETLIEPGDHVISIKPAYQQHYSIPESYGAQVSVLQLQAHQGYLPDRQALASLIRPNTRLIALSNPNNPTGSLMEADSLKQFAAVAADVGAWVLCDEVYRGTNQHGDGFAPAMADLYEKGISVGSMSKTFSLAGLRLGWVAAANDLISKIAVHRDYNTISVGVIDDYLSAIALENKDQILARSQRITRENLQLLSEWVDAEPLISWVKPQSGTTALLEYSMDIPSRELCVDLLHQTGVLLTPGSVMDQEGTVRIGYANSTSILSQGLQRFSDYLRGRW